MRIILSPACLFRLFDAADHARRARLVFQWAAERLLNEVETCAECEPGRFVLRGGALDYADAVPRAEIAEWLRDGAGFDLRPIDW